MPNSDRVALVLTEAVVGLQVWQDHVCDTMPDAEYQRTKLAAIGVLELTARAIDWPRLLEDAEVRHRTVHPGTCPTDQGGYGRPRARDVCGECLREALLAHGFTGYGHDWSVAPRVTRRAGDIDWPRVFADTIAFRRPGWPRTRANPQTPDAPENVTDAPS